MYQDDWEKLLADDDPEDSWMDQEDRMELQLDQIRELIGEPSEPVSTDFQLSEDLENAAPAEEPAEPEAVPEPGADSSGEADWREDTFTRSLYELLDGPANPPQAKPDARTDPPPDEELPVKQKKAKKEKKPKKAENPRKEQSNPAPAENKAPGNRASCLLVVLLLLELIGIGAVALCWMNVLMK